MIVLLMRRLDFINTVVADWARINPKAGSTYLRAAQLIVWSGRLAQSVLDRSATTSGLRRRGDYEVLALLRRFEPELLTPVDVSDQLRVSPSGMTGKLDRLEMAGLLARMPDASDRRVVRIELTNDGRRLADEAFAASARVYEAIFDHLAQSEMDALSEILSRVIIRLEELVDSQSLTGRRKSR